MTALRLRRHAHHGSVIAAGFALDAAWLGVGEARRRVLALWAPGATVTEHAGTLLVTGLRAGRVRVEHAPGAPLVEHDGLLTAAPLTTDEHAALLARGGRGAVVLVAGGGATIVTPAAAGAGVDVAAWIDLGAPTLVPATALAAPPPAATLPVPVRLDLRAAVGLGPAAAGASALRAALTRSATGATGATGDGVAGPAAAGDELLDEPRPPSAWRRLAGWLAQRVAPGPRPGRAAAAAAATSSSSSSSSSSGRAPTAVAPTDLTPAPPRDSWLRRLRERLAAALWTSRLGDSLGRRHAEYLRRMLELFDDGKLDEALRHAIPLGGSSRDGGGGLSVSVPRPRSDVALSLVPPAGRSSIPVATTATDMIRARYQAALQRLLQQGRIDEAAFVLADLLGDIAAAVALLEQHERFALAARLAEGHDLEPGLITRLWFLAGDRDRAIAVARRHHAWADAVARLERARDPRAAALRLLWADQLASAGDYAQAVDVAWAVTEAQALVRTWVTRGIAAEGTAGARLLVKQLVLAPASYAATVPAVLEVLDDPDADGLWRRQALIDTLIASPTSSELRTLARAALRALQRDIGGGADGEAPALLPRLIRFADDAALRADQPMVQRVTRTPALVDRGQPVVRHWRAADAGAVPIHDAALVPGGRVLVALGELGVRLHGRDGGVTAHFDQPATQLVPSDHGTQALALTPRGRYLRVARLDLVDRRARHWVDAECDEVARTYDGDVWWTSRRGQVLAIDATAARWTATWGVDTEAARCVLARDGKHVAVDARTVDASELWFYEGFTLRRRRELRLADGDMLRAYLAAPRPTTQDWLAAVVLPATAAAAPAALAVELRGDGWSRPLDALAPVALEVDGRFAAVAQRGGDGVVVTVVYVAGRVVIARLALDGATTVCMRLAELALTLADDRGRLIVLDLRTGAVPIDRRLGA